MELSQVSDYVVGIYCRLSKDDGLDGDSSSIQNQKETLIKYCNDKNWMIGGIYCDDGYSGTNFNRPDFNRLIDDIKLGKINCVITKDLSRLGRNYVQVGYYQEELFPKYNCRYIAVNDNVDSLDDSNDFIGVFKNVINEYYAKDVSKKIKFTIRNKAKKGESRRTPRPLYGYMYDKDNNRVPNPETAPIVNRIFKLFIETKSSRMICNILISEKIYSPAYYNFLKSNDYYNKYNNCNEEKKYNWTQSCISRILHNVEYLGHYITQKNYKESFKSKKIIVNKNPYFFANKFKPLITQEEFDECQRIYSAYNKLKKPDVENNFKKIVYCGCCGKVLSYGKRNERQSTKSKYRYYCRNKECQSRVYINREVLNEIVLKEIKELFNIILENEIAFINYAESLSITYDTSYNNQINGKKRSLLHLKKEYEEKLKRAKELYISGDLDINDYNTFKQDYEDKIANTINDYNVLENEKDLRNYKAEATNYIDLLKSLKDEDLLSTNVLISLIDKIEITKNPRNKDISIKITYPKIHDIIGGFINEESE